MSAGVVACAAQLRFPLQEGDLAGREATMTFPATRGALEDLVPAAEPCEGRCGSRVGPSQVSGEAVGLFDRGPLRDIRLPRGLWEAPHDEVAEVDDEPREVVALVFHTPQRCRELRGPEVLKVAIDADCPGCGYPERSFDPQTGMFGCSSLNFEQCDYTSSERDR